MPNKNSLLNDFSKSHPEAEPHGGEIYLPFRLAEEFLGFCVKNDLAIVGIEGFLPTGKSGKIPQLDMVIDFVRLEKFPKSWQEYCEYCTLESRRFFQQLTKEGKNLEQYIFNYCVFEKEDWKGSEFA